jgi:hypothetical protein
MLLADVGLLRNDDGVYVHADDFIDYLDAAGEEASSLLDHNTADACDFTIAIIRELAER